MQDFLETTIPVWQGEDPWLYFQRHRPLTMPEAHWHSHQAMLADTDEKILSIALDCGFASLSRFYDAFRNRFGTTPRHYREEWRKRQATAGNGSVRFALPSQ